MPSQSDSLRGRRQQPGAGMNRKPITNDLADYLDALAILALAWWGLIAVAEHLAK